MNATKSERHVQAVLDQFLIATNPALIKGPAATSSEIREIDLVLALHRAPRPTELLAIYRRLRWIRAGNLDILKDLLETKVKGGKGGAASGNEPMFYLYGETASADLLANRQGMWAVSTETRENPEVEIEYVLNFAEAWQRFLEAAERDILDA